MNQYCILQWICSFWPSECADSNAHVFCSLFLWWYLQLSVLLSWLFLCLWWSWLFSRYTKSNIHPSFPFHPRRTIGQQFFSIWSYQKLQLRNRPRTMPSGKSTSKEESLFCFEHRASLMISKGLGALIGMVILLCSHFPWSFIANWPCQCQDLDPLSASAQQSRQTEIHCGYKYLLLLHIRSKPLHSQLYMGPIYLFSFRDWTTRMGFRSWCKSLIPLVQAYLLGKPPSLLNPVEMKVTFLGLKLEHDCRCIVTIVEK